MSLAHFSAKPGEFLLAALPHALLVEPFHGRIGNCRPVVPKFAQHVGTVYQFISAQAVRLAEGIVKFLHGTYALAETVEGNPDRFICEMAGKPFGNQHFTGNTCLVQFYARAGKLQVCLDEVACIGPKPSVIPSDHQVAGLAGESARPLHLFPTWSGIFAAVGIGARDDHRIIAEIAHLRDPAGI